MLNTKLLTYSTRLLAVLIFISQCYFIPFIGRLIYTEGGPMGIGLLAIPFLLIGTLALIPAVLSFRTSPTFYHLGINLVGFIYNYFWIWMMVSTPAMD